VWSPQSSSSSTSSSTSTSCSCSSGSSSSSGSGGRGGLRGPVWHAIMKKQTAQTARHSLL
jgi:hypothetical protein